MAIDLSYTRGSVKEVADKLGIDPGRLSKWRQNDSSQVRSTERLSEEQKEVKRPQKKLKEAQLEWGISKRLSASPPGEIGSIRIHKRTLQPVFRREDVPSASGQCQRLLQLALTLCSRRTAKNSAHFLERVVEQMPFSVQRVQTDRGREFFGLAFQEKLREYGIKLRPVKPRFPHLNGKVERSHQTDLQEFYERANLKDPQLNDQLEEWQFHYNWYRAHSSLKGKAPMDVVTEKLALTPLWEDIEAKYDPAKEPIREQNYGWERKLSKYRPTSVADL